MTLCEMYFHHVLLAHEYIMFTGLPTFTFVGPIWPFHSFFILGGDQSNHLSLRALGGLKNLLYNRAGAECNGADTFFSVKDSGVLRIFSK